VTWQVLSAEAARDHWDDWLQRFTDFSYTLTFAWGEHRRGFGWSPIYLVARDRGEQVTAMALGLYRRYPLGIATLWIPGGPAGDATTLDDSLRQAARRAIGASRLYIRLLSHQRSSAELVRALEGLGWRRCPVRLRSGLTMYLSLEGGLASLEQGLSGNWRHNLRRAGKQKIRVRRWQTPHIGEVVAAYESMEAYKGLPQQFTRRELESLFNWAGDSILVYRADSLEGELLAFRACLVFGSLAWDLLAVTTEGGRKVYASYALLWEILTACDQAGVRRYDLAGVDPEQNPGVYNFKKGTGAELIELLGEWETATFPGLVSAVSLGLKWRQRRRRG
jgi:lipid II:glycine glycyltransferase (peptidoglycan interpeptide bridge formation enzyme)